MQRRSYDQTAHDAGGRGGYSLVEMVVAGIVLGVVMTVSLQLLAATSRQQRYAERRQLAAEELANLMERLSAAPYETLDGAAQESWTLSDAVTAHLRDAELGIDIQSTGDDLGGKQISLSLRWRDAGDVMVTPVRLTTWVYPPAGGTR